jgi:hypothetical protein
LNLHQNVQSSNTKKLSILIKISLTALFSLMLLAVSININSPKSMAATVPTNAQQTLATSAKVNQTNSLDKSVSSNAHSSLNVPVSFVQPNAVDTTSIIRQVFGIYSNQALSIAMCESSMNPNATNSYPIDGSHAAGLFQILYPSTWYTTSEAGQSPYNAVANTQAAYQIFQRDGYSWREWECQP